MMLTPPSNAGNPYRPVNKPPVRRPVSLPAVRVVTATREASLAGLAEMYYSNPREAQRIFNANRAGKRREDGTMGFLENMEQIIRVGDRLVIP